MRIIDIKTKHISVPLKTPFKTALRTVSRVEDIIVIIITDEGSVGYGEAPPTEVITGDTKEAIISAVEIIKRSIIGMDIENIEGIMVAINGSMAKNTSAKAAIDMAVYDLYGQLYKAPLYKLLGGYRRELVTDITISINSPEEMVRDSLEAVARGYNTLKVKLGKDSELDIARLKSIRKAVGSNINLRVDANQGWKRKEAVRVLRKMEDLALDIEFIEQPVEAHDIDGLKFVSDNTAIPVMADESVFSPQEALKIMETRAAELINIKLMKCGGIYNALKICSLAEIYGIECMIGCMLEAKVSVTAAVQLAAAKKVITKIDLDGPCLCSEDPIEGGAMFNESFITLQQGAGLGITGIKYV